MGIFDSLRAVFRPRLTYQVSMGPHVSVADMGIDQLYRTQPNLRAVVSYLTDNAAQVPIKVYDRVSDVDRVRVTDSPAALLLEHPNPDMTAYELKRRIYGDLYLYDRHVSILVPDADADSGWRLQPIPARWVVGYEGSNPFAPEAIYVQSDNGRKVAIPAERFIYFHGYDPADVSRQCSPVEALADVLHEQVESNSFRRQMWRNGGRFNAYIRRPADVEDWTDEAFERFRQSWDESWGGRTASQGGKMPILEDGMEIRTVPFSAHDAEWSEAKRLGREDVAAVYHVNPALVWPGSGQTYASAKENARALYNDTLAPTLMQVTDRLNAILLPRVNEPDGHYLEYDLSVKLQGSFEERAAVIQSAVGGPWMTRDEARAMFNLPKIEGADELIVPLNVVEGGLASPRDTDPTIDRHSLPAPTKECGCAECKGHDGHRHKALATDEEQRDVADVLAKFFERQAKSVLPKIGASKGKAAKADGDPAWWDSERWDRELEDDLFAVSMRIGEASALRAVDDLGTDASKFSARRTNAYIRSMCKRRARWVNQTTRDRLVEVVEDEEAEVTPRDVFDDAESTRSISGGGALAVAVTGWMALEVVRQTAPRRGATKTWVVTSGNPRPSHASMNGETVPYSEPFSNGAMWPGDADALDVDEVAGCQCAVDIEIP